MRFLFLCCVLLVTTKPAQAFVSYYANGQLLRYNLVSPNADPNVVNRSTKAIRYFIASDAYSAANRDAELNAVRACFAQWQSIPGTSLRFEDAGLVAPGIDLNPGDHTNVVYWARTTDLAHSQIRNNIRGLSGYTEVSIAGDNTILGSDTVLNGAEFEWFTDFNNSASISKFVESVLLHEIGHAIGLDHSPVGAATVAQGRTGISTEAGLSSDEIAAARFLYPDPAFYPTLGMIKGVVSLNGAPVTGAAVFAEDNHGNIVEGTVSRTTDGGYELPALPAGNYNVRVCPLDPKLATDYLRRGRDIAGDYADANTGFLPSQNFPVSVNAGGMVTQNIAVTAGTPFRITALSKPTTVSGLESIERFAEQMSQGQSGYFIGVSGSLPTSGATLNVTGDGITTGTPIFKPDRFGPGINYIGIPISIAADATPGMRSLVVQQGGNTAYANGYLEIKPPFPDFNFDGLNDVFQRQFFSLFTAPEAGPVADPDQDGLSNAYEERTGTNPKDANSYYLKVERVKLTRLRGTVTFKSDIGKTYRIWSRVDLTPANPWQVIGTVTASSTTTDFTDSAFGQNFRFYRIELLR
jgi:hypothetical protein